MGENTQGQVNNNKLVPERKSNPIGSEIEDEAGDLIDLDREIAVGMLWEKDPWACDETLPKMMDAT